MTIVGPTETVVTAVIVATVAIGTLCLLALLTGRLGLGIRCRRGRGGILYTGCGSTGTAVLGRGGVLTSVAFLFLAVSGSIILTSFLVETGYAVLSYNIFKLFTHRFFSALDNEGFGFHTALVEGYHLKGPAGIDGYQVGSHLFGRGVGYLSLEYIGLEW